MRKFVSKYIRENFEDYYGEPFEFFIDRNEDLRIMDGITLGGRIVGGVGKIANQAFREDAPTQALPLYIQNEQPETNAENYMWIQTGIGPDGNDFTFWFEDGDY